MPLCPLCGTVANMRNVQPTWQGKTEVIKLRVTPKEKLTITKAAKAAKIELSPWARAALMDAAEKGT